MGGGWAYAANSEGGDLRAAGGIGLRKIHDGPLHYAAVAGGRRDCRRVHQDRRRGSAPVAGNHNAQYSRKAYQHDISGANVKPESGNDGGGPDWRSVEPAFQIARSGGTGTHTGNIESGGYIRCITPHERISVPVFGWNEAADNDCYGAGWRAGATYRR